MQRLTRSSPDSLAATLAAQPSTSLALYWLHSYLARNDKWDGGPGGGRQLEINLAATNYPIAAAI